MPVIQKTEGIIISCRDFTETSQLVTLFTKDFGKIKVIAKGSRRPNSKKFKSKLDLFNQAEVVFYRNSKGELHTLSECHILNIFTEIHLDLNRMALASYMMELLNVSLGLEDGDKQLYELVIDILHWLSNNGAVNTVRHVFEIKLLNMTGVFPQMSSCSKCNNHIKGTASLNMPSGWLCIKCSHGRHCISKGSFALMNSIVKVKRPQAIRINILQLKEIKTIIRLIIDYSIHKRLKSLDFLERVCDE